MRLYLRLPPVASVRTAFGGREGAVAVREAAVRGGGGEGGCGEGSGDGEGRGVASGEVAGRGEARRRGGGWEAAGRERR